MSRRPPQHELKFIDYVKNHRELTRKLGDLDVDAPEILEYAFYVGGCWFRLAEQHLEEAEKSLAADCRRAVFSRSYYAAYNASKAIRYIVNGTVSLAGDDHQKAGTGLPKGFPDLVEWMGKIEDLYKHRLRADYDNWSDTTNKEEMTPEEAVQLAREFLELGRAYIKEKFERSL